MRQEKKREHHWRMVSEEMMTGSRQHSPCSPITRGVGARFCHGALEIGTLSPINDG